MDVLVTQQDIKLICDHLADAISNQHYDGIIQYGKKAKTLYSDFSALKTFIGREMNKLKLEHVVSPNAKLNADS